MTIPSKTWSIIADGQVDADSPLDTTLITAIRDNEIHLEEWLGDSYVAAKDHDHDGVNSSLIGENSIVTTALHVSRFEYYPRYDSVTVDDNGASADDVIVAANSGLGGVAVSLEEDASWIRLFTSATSGHGAAYRNGQYGTPWSEASDHVTRIGFGNTWKLQVRTDDADIADTRIWVGFSNVSPATHLDDTPDGFDIAFRYSTAEGDTNWMCVAINGTGATGTYTDSGVAVVANTEVTLEVRTSPGEAKYYIDGDLVATITTNLPSATQGLGWFFMVHNIAAASNKELYFRRLSFNHSAS